MNESKPNLKYRKSSVVWKYMTVVDNDRSFAKCNMCSQKLSYKTSVSNLKQHLMRRHKSMVVLPKPKSSIVKRAPSETQSDPDVEIVKTEVEDMEFEEGAAECNIKSEASESFVDDDDDFKDQLQFEEDHLQDKEVENHLQVEDHLRVEDLLRRRENSQFQGVKIQIAKNGLQLEEEHPVRGHSRASSDSREFREATKRDALRQLRKELDVLLQTSTEPKKDKFATEFDGFAQLFDRFLGEAGPSLEWDKIQRLSDDDVLDYSTLQTPTCDLIHNMLQKLIVVKLNGGLGTSMGCHGPKSVIAVRNDLTFLDLTVQQIEHLNKIYKTNVPLVLMNSFNTDDDTEKVIRKYKNLQVEIHTFNQSCYPRVNRETLLPISKNCNIEDDLEAWYPPGHGDFYKSFQNSGLLKKFLTQGREYCFISNIDNLGATVDLRILNLLLNPSQEHKHEFVMEVTDKTRADVKGGTLIQYENKLRLLEIAQVPNEHVDDFKSVKTFKFFNTNNLWAKLDAIDRVLSEDTLKMEIIINNKTLHNGVNVIQLETAVGAAMKSFEGGIGINVPRSRFLPVKKTSDLLLVMSNLYSLKNGSLIMSPQRMFPTTPLVKLGDNHFSKVKEFLGRFANIPDLIELDHLTVSGDVTFGRGVSLKGTVIIIANHGDRIDIPSGANLENKIVSGNMRILDH